MTNIQPNPQAPPNIILHRIEVRKHSPRAKFLKIFIFVAVRNFYRQHAGDLWISRMSNLLPVEISDGNKNKIFEKFSSWR